MSKTGRRGFLKTVAAAGTLPLPALAAAGDQSYPRVYSGRSLAMISFPLGGVGAGSIGLGGRGQFRDWQIFNRPNKGHSPQYAFASIWAGGVARVLEARIQPPYEGPSGLGSANVPGLPRLESATFTGEFPLARIDFSDADLPVRVGLEAFTPFIPNDDDASGLPMAVLRYRVTNPAAAAARVSIAFSLDNPVGEKGRANEYRAAGGIEGLLMRNPFLSPSDPLAGSFTLCVVDPAGGKVTYLRGWRAARWLVGPQSFWDDFSADGELGPEAAARSTVGSLCLARTVAARGEAEFTFLLAWQFPNRTPERCGWSAPDNAERVVIGNHYCTRFADAWQAVEYASSRLPALEARTRRFTAAMRETTLPGPLKEAAMANLSTLVSPTCFRTADGRFHGFEGCNDNSGCCFGDCTHVWNYEPATQFLFARLARSLRESAFGFCTDGEGRMDFRRLLPEGKEHWDRAAADGQMGQIIKLHLDWKLCGDTTWLRKLWPAAKRAMAFAWIPGGWDADQDGVMEGVQHNTYDVEFLGPNPLCGVWYLGALRASEEMARAMGDGAFADRCRRLFQNGSRWIDDHLFNGEYYIQQIRGMPPDKVAKGLVVGMGAASTEKPDFQLGEGCLVDQLAGQYFADVAGLGPLLDAEKIRKTLESIFRYNYKRSLYRHESVQRTYALNDEAALVICDYAGRRRPEIPFPYFAEVMTGFEYSAAVLMLNHGMVAQGLECIANIRRRYDGERRNPWDEAECGHHYARAMASWAAIPALSGFRYDAVEKVVTVMPPGAPEKLRSFWSAATGWGSFALQGGAVRIAVTEGTLALREVRLASGGVLLTKEVVLREGQEFTAAAAR